MAELETAIRQSCSVLLLLTDEVCNIVGCLLFDIMCFKSFDSKWVKAECKVARRQSIPIIPILGGFHPEILLSMLTLSSFCVTDADLMLPRDVIDLYMERGYGWLFGKTFLLCLLVSLVACPMMAFVISFSR